MPSRQPPVLFRLPSLGSAPIFLIELTSSPRSNHRASQRFEMGIVLTKVGPSLSGFFLCEKKEGWVAGPAEGCSDCRTACSSHFGGAGPCHSHGLPWAGRTLSLKRVRTKLVKNTRSVTGITQSSSKNITDNTWAFQSGMQQDQNRSP